MAGPKSGIDVSEKLKEKLEEMRKEECPLLAVKIQIQEDTQLELMGEKEGSPSRDLKPLAAMVDTNLAAYFLLRNTPSKWTLVSWIPEDLSKVKDRMLYASTHHILKDALGVEFISDDLHVTSMEELGVAKPSIAAAPSSSGTLENVDDNLLSSSEKALKEAHKQESQARKEMAPPSGIGGYHSVSVPMTEETQAAVEAFKSQSQNLVILSLSPDGQTVVLKEALQISPSSLQQHIEKKEPRYYLYRANSKNVFLYVCPDSSPMKPRMVYSTAKPSVVSSAEQLGVDFAKKLELSDVSECTHDYIVSELNAPIVSSYGSSASPSSASTSTDPFGPRKWGSPVNKPVGSNAPAKMQAHPLFGHSPSAVKHGAAVLPAADKSPFEAGTVSVGAGRKKIVIPPAVAYQ